MKNPTNEEVKKLLTVTAVAFGSGILKRFLGVGAKDIEYFGEKYEKERFQIQEARTQLSNYFKELVNAAKEDTGAERLIFFIDDLDRCRPDHALKLLEALKLYLNITDCVYFLGVDHTALKHVIKEEFQGVDEHEAEYLDKIVQLPFHIPPLDPKQGMKEYVDELVKSDRLEPCKEMLIHCLGDNPRQVKRFVNALIFNDLLSKQILEDDYDPVVLSFLLTIQMLNHNLYQRILPDYRHMKIIISEEDGGDTPWPLETREFYNSFFAKNERLETALLFVEDIPERNILEKYLYMTAAAGVDKEEDRFELGGNLTRTNLEGANLRGATLSYANLQGANLRGTDLSFADLLHARGLTVGQLAQAKTLYHAKLGHKLEKELWKKHPHLFEPPKYEEPPEDV